MSFADIKDGHSTLYTVVVLIVFDFGRTLRLKSEFYSLRLSGKVVGGILYTFGLWGGATFLDSIRRLSLMSYGRARGGRRHDFSGAKYKKVATFFFIFSSIILSGFNSQTIKKGVMWPFLKPKQMEVGLKAVVTVVAMPVVVVEAGYSPQQH